MNQPLNPHSKQIIITNAPTRKNKLNKLKSYQNATDFSSQIKTHKALGTKKKIPIHLQYFHKLPQHFLVEQLGEGKKSNSERKIAVKISQITHEPILPPICGGTIYELIVPYYTNRIHSPTQQTFFLPIYKNNSSYAHRIAIQNNRKSEPSLCIRVTYNL